jgi:EmrB/QacA subfamily drug resistance transporter
VSPGARLSRLHLDRLAPARADAGALGRRQRRVVLVICSVSLFVTYVDTTVLNVALPSIERDFHADLASMQWVADAYLLVLASLLVAAGSIADRVGRRRVFRAGLVLFSAGSLVCSLAQNVDVLIGLRMLQAVGGCMLTPVSLSIVRQVFTDPAERARALGVWSAMFGLGVAAGPILGGMLVSGAGWRSVFWVNVPVGLGAWWLAGRFVPESRAPTPRRLDPAGQALVFVMLASLTFAIIEGPSLGWATPPIVAAFAAGAIATVLLVVVERGRPEPLLELRFFRSPPFSAAIATAVLSFLVLAGFLFVTTLYLQDVRRDSPLVAGVSLLPATVMVAVCALLGGHLVARFGARVPLVAAGLCLVAGAALLLGLTPHTPYALLAAAYVLLGAGFGLVNPPITITAVSGMPPEQAGVASAIASASRQIGSVLGVAVMGSLVTSSAFGTGHLTGHAAVAFTSASHGAWALALACGLACVATAIACTGRRGLRAARAIYHEQTPPE